MKYELTLRDPQTGHAAYASLWPQLKALLFAGHRVEIVAKTETRSSAQNRRMWAMLTDLSRQVEWHGQKLSPSDWKTMCTAALKKQRVVQGMDGGFVVMGDNTSQMTIAEMTELMDFMEAFGAQQGVEFADSPL
jgi:hypothetical protein